MHTILSFGVWTWGVLVACVLLLGLCRYAITRGKYIVLHVRQSELSLIPEQILQDRRLERVDFWGQSLTIVAAVVGLGLLAIYIFAGLASGPGWS
jgi:hypothetical protein